MSLDLRNKPFNKVCWLASHNSFANKQDGWIYAQQGLNIKNQFKLGVRCFLIDIHWFYDTKSLCCSSKTTETLILAHGKNIALNYIQNPNVPRKIEIFLIEIRDLLLNNPSEIITLYIEDYTEDRGVVKLKHILKKLKLLDLCYVKTNKWLKISQMINTNKRLFIITSHRTEVVNNSKFMMSVNILKENDYQKNPSGGLVRRKNGELALFNHFKILKLDFAKKYNSFDKINTRLEGFISSFGVYPNYVTLDYIENGDGMKIVTMINNKF